RRALPHSVSRANISLGCSHGVGEAAKQACLSPGGQRRFRRCVSPVLRPLFHTGQCCLQPTGGHPGGARYHALLIPSCPGALTDLASSGSLARILQHFHSESKPICAIGHGVAALCCATNEDRSWVFQGYSLTGPSVYELIRAPGFARLSLIVEDFVKDSGAGFSASEPDAVHVVLDRHLVTGQNANSTVPAVQNLLFLCGGRK
uniref:Glutamine amidotransferase-like class 1 domain-containing protein 1 n=1 Tax=Rattus norvegicus TaxID=10116 RepID=A0ABK0LYL5_RAT